MSLVGHRASPLWLAALVHRLSGLALAIFLPFHFLVLGLAIAGEASLESFLRWTDQPWVKTSEGILLGLLAVHMLGGLRLLALENLSWRQGQARLAIAVVVAAMIVAFAFLAGVF
jgi:succinate dehydrogenase subunit D